MTRTGTTWLATMLDASGAVVHINEPLNPQHPPGGSPGILAVAPVRHRFQYICSDNEREYLAAYRELLRLRYHPWRELRRNHAPSDLPRLLRSLVSFERGRLLGKRPLVADPFAVFSAEWFARRLGCRVVVAVRHPAAVVSSRKRLGWEFDFRQLLDQPLLMRDHLSSSRGELEAMLGRGGDVVGQGSYLWREIYGSLVELQRRPELLIVRHEDLSLDPVGQFERLYRALDLRFTSRVRNAIERSSMAGNASELSVRHPHRVRLDSRANLDNWRRRLEAEEVARIRSITSDVAAHYYPDIDW
jgi:Sulfotransferase family